MKNQRRERIKYGSLVNAKFVLNSLKVWKQSTSVQTINIEFAITAA